MTASNDYVSRIRLMFDDLASPGFRKVAKAAKLATGAMKGGILAVGGVGTALLAATAATNQATAEQARLANAVGISRGTFFGFGRVAKGLGLDFEAVTDMAEELRNKVGEMNNLGEMTALTEGLQGLGLKFKDIKGLAPEKQFLKIWSAATKLDDKVKAAASLDMMLGGEANKILGAFNNELDRTGSSFERYLVQANRFDFLTQKGIQGALNFNQAFGDLSASTRSLGQEFFGLAGQALAPTIGRLGEFLALNRDVIQTGMQNFLGQIGDAMQQIDFGAIAEGAKGFATSAMPALKNLYQGIMTIGQAIMHLVKAALDGLSGVLEGVKTVSQSYRLLRGDKIADKDLTASNLHGRNLRQALFQGRIGDLLSGINNTDSQIAGIRADKLAAKEKQRATFMPETPALTPQNTAQAVTQAVMIEKVETQKQVIRETQSALRLEITGKIDGAKAEVNAVGTPNVDTGGANGPLD